MPKDNAESIRNADNIRRILASRKKNKSSKNKTVKGIKVNRSLKASYKDIMKFLTSEMQAAIKLDVYPAIDKIESNDSGVSPTDELNAAFGKVDARAEQLVAISSGRAAALIEKMNTHNRARFTKEMRDVMGIDINSVIISKEVNPHLKILTEENFNLIKSIPESQLSKIKTMILQDLSQGKFERADIKKMLQKQFGISERRARMIASDQSHKINASLTMIRSKAIGVTKYVWRNTNDMRVRGKPGGFYPNSKYNHWDREGKVYAYDKPPADGNPGIPINCRCSAEAVLPEIFN